MGGRILGLCHIQSIAYHFVPLTWPLALLLLAFSPGLMVVLSLVLGATLLLVLRTAFPLIHLNLAVALVRLRRRLRLRFGMKKLRYNCNDQ